jgi:hypothetical protein
MWLKFLVLDILPHGDRDEYRFSLDFEVLLTRLEIKVFRDPSMHRKDLLHRKYTTATGDS